MLVSVEKTNPVIAQMYPEPRFQAEYFIRENVAALQTYARVFKTRIAPAFNDLNSETERVQREEYDRLAASDAGPEDDDSHIAELAYHKGVDFYLATDSIRQGVINLMVAGLFHLFEQQAGSLAADLDPTNESPFRQKPTKLGYGWEELKKVLKIQGVDVSQLRSMATIDELRLAANVVKHGDGRSAEELRSLKPGLFDESDPMYANFPPPLLPLTGTGIRLTENDFTTYYTCLDEFWNELIVALAPIFCPPLP